MSGRTNGQWATHLIRVQHAITGPRGEPIAYVLDADDARRIVACVNACEGISNETLEVCKIIPATELERERERDILRRAVIRARDALVSEIIPKPGYGTGAVAAIDACNAALEGKEVQR